LGLPIPGPDKQSVATLEQVAADDSLLRALDIEGAPYPVTAAQAAGVVALIEGSPAYLSRRMRMVELRLTGDRKVVLTVAASSLADRLRSMKHVKGAGLWDLPYRALAQRGSAQAREAAARETVHYEFGILPEKLRSVAAALQQGRLMHIRGNYAQEEDDTVKSANAMYSYARMPKADMDRASLDDRQRTLLEHTKQDASYWLGLVAFERERYPGAADHLKKRTLEDSPNGPWTAGARYNLARTYEAMGRNDEAIALYEQDDSPQRHGNQLRARRLKEQQPAADGAK
jgi:tetratricopeptide (TPR) repeat protein